jgi:TM2 domain-containing membrane protein YozV
MTGPYEQYPPYGQPQVPPPALPAQSYGAPPTPYQYPGSQYGEIVPYGQVVPYGGHGVAHPAAGALYPAFGQPYAAGYGRTPWAPFGVDPRTGRPLSDKSKIVAGLLQILVGGVPVGRFYIGDVGIGIAQLAVGWGVFFVMLCLGIVLILPLFFTWVGFMWPLIDGIVLLVRGGTDAQGRVLRD